MKSLRIGYIAAIMAAVLALASCGTSTDSDGEDGTQGNSLLDEAGADLTGEPIVIVDISEVTGVPGLPAINMPNGARAAAAYINDQGGVGGRPIEIISCDSKFDPGASAACAREAITHDPIAVIGIDDYSATAGDALLESNGIVTLNAPNQPSLMTSLNAFPLGPGGIGEFYGIGHYFGAEKEYKNISLLMHDVPVGRTYAELLESAARDAGVENINTVYYSLQITDFSAPVAKAMSSDPEAVFTLVNGSQMPLAWNLLQQQGLKAEDIYVQGGTLDSRVFEEAGDVAVGTNVISEFTNPDDLSDPDVKLYRDAMDKYGFGGIARSTLAQWGFANVMFLAAAAEEVGADSVNAATVKEFFSAKLGPGSTETLPTFMGSPAGAAPAEFPGIHRPGVSILTWNGEEFETTEDFFTAPQLQPVAP